MREAPSAVCLFPQGLKSVNARIVAIRPLYADTVAAYIDEFAGRRGRRGRPSGQYG